MENEVAPFSFTSIIAAFSLLVPRQIFIHDLPKKIPRPSFCLNDDVYGDESYLSEIDPKLRPLSLRPVARPARGMAPITYVWDLSKGINPRDAQRRKQPPSLG